MLSPSEKAALRKQEGLRHSTWQWSIGNLRERHHAQLLSKRRRGRVWRWVVLCLAALATLFIAAVAIVLRTG